jgi:hypothetical protein
MNEVETEFQSAIATARHAPEQFNAEPVVGLLIHSPGAGKSD